MTENQESTQERQFRLRKHLIQPEALQLVPEAMARKYNIIPLEVKVKVLPLPSSLSAHILLPCISMNCSR